MAHGSNASRRADLCEFEAYREALYEEVTEQKEQRPFSTAEDDSPKRASRTSRSQQEAPEVWGFHIHSAGGRIPLQESSLAFCLFSSFPSDRVSLCRLYPRLRKLEELEPGFLEDTQDGVLQFSEPHSGT